MIFLIAVSRNIFLLIPFQTLKNRTGGGSKGRIIIKSEEL
jgi:hypothetical protein